MGSTHLSFQGALMKIRISHRVQHLFFLSLLLAAFGAQVAGSTGLPDSGQNLCDNGANVLVACSSTNTGDGASYPRQDGRFGRDPAAAGTPSKIGAGAVGFDYTKVANNGSDLPAGAALGAAATDWACTRDNITGLTWEVKTAANTDLRYSGHTYTWYSTTVATNGGGIGVTGANTCNATLPGSLCNTQAYATAVDAAALCGFNNGWRLPTLRELFTLGHYGTSIPTIDTAYFPNTLSSGFWSASSYAATPTLLWALSFNDGYTYPISKTVAGHVLLVHGGQF
jgi:hypothetical protein